MNPGTILPRVRRFYRSATCKLPYIQPQEILEGYADLSIELPAISTHWETATLFDHTLIASLVRVLKPRVCLEIGTSLGLVTTTIAANSPDSTEIHTLDLSDSERIGSFFRHRREAEKIRQHFGPSQSFDFKPLHKSVDFVFIDGSHEYEDVCRDSQNALDIVSDRGVILWHDVTPYFPGVIRALESLPRSGEISRVYGTSCGFYAVPGAPVKTNLTRSQVQSKSDEIAMTAAR